MKTREILEQVYPELTERPRPLGLRHRGWLVTRRWVARQARTVAAVLLLLSAWVVAHLYYYNKLVSLEYDVQAAWAQVETQLQRRHNIQLNLTRMVLDYAEHERSLLTGITKIRTSAVGGGSCGAGADPSAAAPDPAASTPADPAARPGSAPADSSSSPAVAAPARPLDQLSRKELQALFSRIMVVAEQYPQLKLSENFQQFSKAVIDTENEIALRTSRYNEAVNVYGTTLTQFPGNIFAWLGGFEQYQFYQPDKKALEFRRVEF